MTIVEKILSLNRWVNTYTEMDIGRSQTVTIEHIAPWSEFTYSFSATKNNRLLEVQNPEATRVERSSRSEEILKRLRGRYAPEYMGRPKSKKDPMSKDPHRITMTHVPVTKNLRTMLRDKETETSAKVRGLRKAMDALEGLHGLGVSHGDALPKNFARVWYNFTNVPYEDVDVETLQVNDWITFLTSIPAQSGQDYPLAQSVALEVGERMEGLKLTYRCLRPSLDPREIEKSRNLIPGGANFFLEHMDKVLL